MYYSSSLTFIFTIIYTFVSPQWRKTLDFYTDSLKNLSFSTYYLNRTDFLFRRSNFIIDFNYIVFNLHRPFQKVLVLVIKVNELILYVTDIETQ